MKMYEFWLKFHWNLFVGSNTPISEPMNSDKDQPLNSDYQLILNHFIIENRMNFMEAG